MKNPLHSDAPFAMTLRYPQPKATKVKEGPKYVVAFEVPEEEFSWFMDADTRGMVLECSTRVTHSTQEELKGGRLSNIAAMYDSDALFQDFASEHDLLPDKFEGSMAKALIYAYCEISSRRQLDHNPAAKKKFADLRTAFRRWKDDD